ncbi:MAG TPA: cytochrome P450 [Pyrinomonadaceae bacterium]
MLEQKELTEKFNLLDPSVRANPYPLYERLREEEPVHWNNDLGGWVLTRYDDVMSALHNPLLSPGGGIAAMFSRLSEEDRKETLPLQRHLSMWLGTLDPPDHTRVRSLMNKAFTPRLVETLRPFIQTVADELVDAVKQTGQMDIVTQLAVPLPAIVIAQMLGTPREDYERFIHWSLSISMLFGDACATPEIVRAAQTSVLEMTGHLHNLLEERRRSEPKNDLINNFILAEGQDNRISEEEVLANCVMLLFAGHGTITVMIGTHILVLLQNPEVLEAVKQNPSLTPNVIEELLRFDSPCQMIRRTATQDVEIGGTKIQQGQLIWLNLGAANRDQAHCPIPEKLDISRSNAGHLGYGAGIHYCLGAALSRVETEIAINTIVQRLPNLRLASNELDWHPDPTARALKSLPVVFTPFQ